MTARAVRLDDGWRRWRVVCDECPWWRQARSRENAEHLADLHNQAGCGTPRGAA